MKTNLILSSKHLKQELTLNDTMENFNWKDILYEMKKKMFSECFLYPYQITVTVPQRFNLTLVQTLSIVSTSPTVLLIVCVFVADLDIF